MQNLIKYVVGIVVPTFIMVASMTHSATAQQASDMDDVRAANDAFYAALSAQDLHVMLKVWSYHTEIRHIGPRNKVVNVGLDAAMRNWKRLFAAFPEFNITCEENYIRISGSTAWTSVLEKVRWKDETGETQTETHFGTNIFEKHDGKWLMVYHHGSLIP